MLIAHIGLNPQVYQAISEQKYIEEQGLELVKISCYVPTGNCTADGTMPYEGIVSCNREHLGMDCILFDEDFIPIARFQCRDVGGNQLLREGRAIDIFRTDMSRAKAFIKEHPSHMYIKWISRDFEGEIELPEHLQSLEIDKD
jgi:hypothetical protein